MKTWQAWQAGWAERTAMRSRVESPPYSALKSSTFTLGGGGGIGGIEPTLSSLQEHVFGAICINCHVPGGAGSFMLLDTAEHTFQNLVDVPSIEDPTLDRVEPGDPELRRRIESLPEKQRQAVTLYYLDERTVEEVAEMMGLPANTVKTHLHRGRASLAAALGVAAGEVA